MPWYLYLAFKQLFPSGKRLGSFFFLMSVLGVAMGVMVLVIVQSVMGGFGDIHRARMIETSGHVDISGFGRPFYADDDLMEYVSTRANVEHVAPYAKGFVMAQHGNLPTFPSVIGIDPTLETAAYQLAGTLLEGSIESLTDDGVIISTNLASQMAVKLGDVIEVYTPLMIEGLKSSEVLLPVELEVVGVYNIDWNPDLAPGLIVTIRAMGDLYGLGNRIHGLTVRMNEDGDEYALAAELNGDLPSYLNARTWKEQWASFLWVLDLEKTMMLFINLIIVAVAVFTISVAQLLNVLRKTREIGVLATFGATPRSIWGIYCWQGVIIGFLGTLLGILMAVALLAVRDPIIFGLAGFTGTRDTLIEYYYFAHLPIKYSLNDFVIIVSSALFLSTLAGIVPAWRAARLKPAEAIRTEF